MLAALPNIGGALCESYIIPFLLPRLWLMPTASVPCSNADNTGECKTWTQSAFCTWQNSVKGKETPKYSVPAQEMANIMQSLADLR